MKNRFALSLFVCLTLCPWLRAQDPVGAIEGMVTDASQAPAIGHITVRNLDTGFTKESLSPSNGFFRVPLLPVGRYNVTVDAPHFSTMELGPRSILARRFE